MKITINPIRRVASLAKHAQKRIVEEGERDQDLFGKFMGSCRAGAKDLEKSIAKNSAEAQVPQLESTLEEASARNDLSVAKADEANQKQLYKGEVAQFDHVRTQEWGAPFGDPEAQSGLTARPQVVNGSPYFAEDWGITAAQVSAFLAECQMDPSWSSEFTMYDWVERYVMPKTKGTGLGYGLLINRAKPLRISVMVSHAWAENVEEFVAALERSTSPDEALFVCAFALYQCEDGAGPDIGAQLGSSAAESPFMRVLHAIRKQGDAVGFVWRWRRVLVAIPTVVLVAASFLFCTSILFCVHTNHVTTDKVLQGLGLVACLAYGFRILTKYWRAYNGRMLVVPNRQCDLYSRLWCVFEVFAAANVQVPIVLAQTLARAGTCEASGAKCRSGDDERSIRELIEQGMGYEAVNAAIARTTRSARMSAIFTTLGGGIPLVLMLTSFITIRDFGKANGLLAVTARMLGTALGFVPGLAGAYWTARRGIMRRGFVTKEEALRLSAALGTAGGILLWCSWALDRQRVAVEMEGQVHVSNEIKDRLKALPQESFSLAEVLFGFATSTLLVGVLLCLTVLGVHVLRCARRLGAPLGTLARWWRWALIVVLAVALTAGIPRAVYMGTTDVPGCWLHCMVAIVCGALVMGPLALIGSFAASWGISLGPSSHARPAPKLAAATKTADEQAIVIP